MALTKPEIACDKVMQTLKVSRLTFSVKETPYSAYLTIRKKFIPNSELLPSALSDLNPISSLKFRELEVENRNLCDTIDILKKKCEQKESENNALNLDKKSAESTNKKLQCCFGASKLEKEKLKDELESVEKDWKIFE